MSYILFDDNSRHNLLPFAHTRAIADIRCGIYTMRERWEEMLRSKTDTLTENYLQGIYTSNHLNDVLEKVYGMPANIATIYINGSVFATADLAKAINKLKEGQKLVNGAVVIAASTEDTITYSSFSSSIEKLEAVNYEGEVKKLNNIWDIFSMNGEAIKEDFTVITKGKKSAALPAHVIVTGKDNIFIEEGAKVYAGCIINAENGPVYIGKDVEVLEGTMMRGPIALCESAVVKMGAKLYGATTIGPGCKVGGEINNVVFFANSNKAHDGYLGNAVIGDWCNLGADTNCSNLKNNYDEVKIWNEHTNKSVSTGLTFCGLFMGDHSKCAINTSFNTGTVVGVSSNIFGNGFPEKFVPSFCWGGSEGMTTYSIDRAMETANRMMGRRDKQLNEADKKMFAHIFEQTAEQRKIFASSK
ncbi:MAG: glucose-phosphate thymidylyltransferase [Flavipsychrobacter sp.]|nr:glucose-phosphate thymidylyltransferase [Flavipsychrobacter sp.]